jgi:glutamate--cysteine ligase
VSQPGRARWRAELAAELRGTAFAGMGGRAPRIGAEVELIPLDADTQRVVAVRERLLPFLRAHGRLRGWREQPSPKGAPRFAVSGGGAVTLEPGGQIEYAAPPFATAGELLDDLRAETAPLIAAGRSAGIVLLAAGIDPCNPIDDVPLQVASDRYRRMDGYLAGIGPSGARMMRQTASVQVNVDPAGDPLRAWCMLNAAAPYLTAMFANSPVYAGWSTGHASYRAHVWRELDPARTGIFPCIDDPVLEYADFVLDAPVIARRTAAGEHLPLCEWLARETVPRDRVADHVSTLFPDVRPRGYFEVRSIDALPLEWLPAPVLVLAGLVMDADASAEAAALLGSPDPVLLRCAGVAGVRDDALARTAARLAGIALAACERGDLCGPADLATAREFLQRYTLRGRSPADDVSAGADTGTGPAQPLSRRRARRSKTTSPFRIM